MTLRSRAVRPLIFLIVPAVALLLLFTLPASAASSYIYAESPSGYVYVVDPATASLVTTIDVGGNPQCIVANPAGTEVYVADENNSRVDVIDTKSLGVTYLSTGTAPYCLAVNPAGTKLAVGYGVKGTSLSIVDLASGQASDFSAGVQGYGIAFNPAGTKVYETDWSQDRIAIVDLASGQASYIPTSGKSMGLAENPAGTKIYVLTQGPDNNYNVSVIDTASGQEAAKIVADASYCGVAVNPAGTRVYVPDRMYNNIYVLDATTNRIVDTIDLGKYNNAMDISVSPDGSRLYAAGDKMTSDYNITGGFIKIVDPASHQIDTVNLDKPAFVCCLAQAPGSGSSNGNGSVALGSVLADSGTVQVPVMGEGLKDLGSLDLSLTYDPGALTFNSASAGSLTGSSTVNGSAAGVGVVNLSIVDGNGISGTGSLAILTFDVIGNSSVSQSDLVIQSLTARDRYGHLLNLSSVNGTFRFGSLKGDLNGDGNVTSVDALMALRMSVGKLPGDPKGDMNGDGQVTAADALAILNLASAQASSEVTARDVSGGL